MEKPKTVTARRASQHDPPVLIFVERPRCPECGSVRLLARKTLDGGDGTITRRCRCDGCGARVDLVLE